MDLHRMGWSRVVLPQAEGLSGVPCSQETVALRFHFSPDSRRQNKGVTVSGGLAGARRRIPR